MDNLPSTARQTTVPAQQGYAFRVQKGEKFRVVDLFGNQIVDFMAFKDANIQEHVRMSYTRYSLRGRTPKPGDYLLTNTSAKAIKIIADTYGIHDMTFMPCYPEYYQSHGIQEHRSCTMNIAEAMAPYGIRSRLELPDPFNIFQNSPKYELDDATKSKPGDYIEFEAQMDLIVAVSCCPADVEGWNGNHTTDIAVVTNL